MDRSSCSAGAGRTGSRVVYEGDGYLLLYKRASDGSFRWPRDSAEAKRLTQEDFGRLMHGIEIDPGIRPFRPTKY